MNTYRVEKNTTKRVIVWVEADSKEAAIAAAEKESVHDGNSILETSYQVTGPCEKPTPPEYRKKLQPGLLE